MKKIISTTLVALTAVAALSACDMATSSNAAGKTHHQGSTAGHKTKAPATPKYTAAQDQAIQAAQSYLSIGTGFSRAGLIGQLTSKAGNGFKTADGVFAVNHVKVDWNKQAVTSAKSYLAIGTGFSRTSLIEQLTSQAGSQFTLAQATYAANHVGL
jgi:hypothetical protein